MNLRMLSPPDDFKTALIWSAAAHLLFVLLLTVRAIFFAGEPLHLESAIRVDIVGLPDKARSLPEPLAETLAEPLTATAPSTAAEKTEQEATKAALPVKSTDAPPAVVLKPKMPDPKESKKHQDAAMKRLEALARLERQAKADAAVKALASTGKSGQVKGNAISRGSSLTGLTRLDHDRYLDEIESRIRKLWNPPKFLAKAGLRVRIVLFINNQGLVTAKKTVQSSGNSVFDDSVTAAIDGAQPFAPPPDSLSSLLAQQGVELDLEPAGHR